MIAEPVVYHDKFLVGNGESCKGTGRGPLPAEVIVANTRPAGRQAALVQAAREAREAAEISALHQEVEAKAVAAAQPVEVICGIPLPVQFGMRGDESVWLGCGVELVEHVALSFSGTPRAACAFATMLNALPEIRAALRAVRSEAKDPDTDAAVSAATGDLVESALRALGERL